MNLANVSQMPLPVLLSLVGLLFLALGMGRGPSAVLRQAQDASSVGMALGAAFVAPILFQLWLSRMVAAEIGLLVAGAIASLVATVKLSSVTR